MSSDYEVELSSEALVATASPDVIRFMARQEIDELLSDGLGCLGNLCFHTFYIGEETFICSPLDNDVLLVDLAEYEAGPVLEEGPFKGMRVQMPRSKL